MRRIKRLTWLVCLLLGAALLILSNPSTAQQVMREEAEKQAKEKQAKNEDSWESWDISQTLKEKLSKRVGIPDCTDRSFTDIVQDFSAVLNFDRVFADQAKLTKKLTVRISSMTAGQALKVVLDLSGFYYEWEADVLYVSAEKRQLDMKVLKPGNIPLDKAVSILTKELGTEGSVQPLESMNALLVRGSKAKIKALEELLKLIDEAPLQVMIESILFQVSTNDWKNLGITWGAPTSTTNLSGMNGNPFTNVYQDHVGSDAEEGGPYRSGTGVFTMPGPSPLLAGGQIGVGVSIDHFTLAAKIDAMQSVGKAKVLSSPRIAVINGGEAKILVGKEVVYNMQTSNTGTGSNVTTSEFRQVGIKLTVKPTISHDGYVTMELEPEVSDIIGSTDVASPPIANVSAKTKVRVKDNQTVIIGGLITKKEEHLRGRVPGVSRIPLLGNLFKNKSDVLEQAEYVFIITPHVIRTDDDWDLNTIPRPGVSPQAMESYKKDLLLQQEEEKRKKAKEEKPGKTPKPEKKAKTAEAKTVKVKPAKEPKVAPSAQEDSAVAPKKNWR